jgi:hypothetical protein
MPEKLRRILCNTLIDINRYQGVLLPLVNCAVRYQLRLLQHFLCKTRAHIRETAGGSSNDHGLEAYRCCLQDGSEVHPDHLCA